MVLGESLEAPVLRWWGSAAHDSNAVVFQARYRYGVAIVE